MIRAAVLGGDVSRSRSPAIHLAAFRALGLEGTYEAISLEARGFRRKVRELGAAGYTYLNVTIPHKRLAAAVADRRAPLVSATGAANTLIFSKRPRGDARAIRADNTDGHGLLTALEDLGAAVAPGQIVVMVGAGGAAAGAVPALLAAGARLRILARRSAAARALGARLPDSKRRRIETGTWTAAALARALEGASTVISAVPAAAWGEAEARAGLRALGRTTAVLEMAYGDTTPLAQAVRGLVTRYQDGLPMLVHQAARAVELAVGERPPVAPLMRAARRA